MNIDLYKELVNSAVGAYRAFSDSTKAQINAITALLTPFRGVELKKEDLIPDLSVWETRLNLVKQDTSVFPFFANLLRLLTLHDGTYLAVFSNAEALHLTADFTLISELPFTFATLDVLTNTQGYFDPGGASASFFYSIVGDENQKKTMIAISVPSAHVVQLYTYDSNQVFSFKQTLGTIGTSGNGSSVGLTSPEAVDLCWVPSSVGSNTFVAKIFVACQGLNAEATTGFIKYFALDSSLSSINSHFELSYPSQYTSSIRQGSLAVNETALVKSLRISSDLGDKLVVVNKVGANYEVGELSIPTLLAPLANKTVLTKTVVLDLGFGDAFSKPTVVQKLNNQFLLGDTYGHFGLLSASLNNIISQVGKPKSVGDPSFKLSYPYEMGTIVDIVVQADSSVLLCCADGAIFSSNILKIGNQSLVFATQPLAFSGRIEKIVGLNEGAVTVSLDSGITWYPIDYYELKTIDVGTSVFVKVEKTLDQILKEPLLFSADGLKPDIRSGYIVFSF